MALRQVRGHLSSRSKHVDTARSAPTANESYKPWTKTKLSPQAPVDIQLHIPHLSQEKALWTVMQVGAWDICSEEWEVFKAPRGNRHIPHSCKQWWLQTSPQDCGSHKAVGPHPYILKWLLRTSKSRIHNSILLGWRQAWDERKLSQCVATYEKHWGKSLGGKFFCWNFQVKEVTKADRSRKMCEN